MATQNKSLKFKLKSAGAALLLGTVALPLAACGSETKEARATKSAPATTISASKSPVDQKFTLKEGEALDVDAFFASLSDDGDVPFTYDSSTFDSKKGATIITNLLSDDGGSEILKVGRLELYGVNEANIEQLKAGTPSEDKLDLFRKIRAFDIAVTDGSKQEQMELSIAALEVDGLKVKSSDEDALSGLSEGQEFAAGLDGFELGGIYLKDLSMKMSEEDDMNVAFNFGDMRLGAIGGGKFGGLYIADMDYDVKQSDAVRQDILEEMPDQLGMLFQGPLANLFFPGAQTGSIGEFTWDGADITGLLGYLRSGEKPPVSAKNLIKFGAIETKKVQTSINGKVAATSEKSRLDPIEFDWLVPTRIASSDKTGTLNLAAYFPAEEEAIQTLVKDNKLDKIASKSEFLWDYDSEKGDAKLFTDTKMKGFANLFLEVSLSDAPLAPIVAAGEAGEKAPGENIALDGFTLRIQDEALLNLAFGIAGQQYKQSSDEMRQTAVGMLGFASLQASQLGPEYTGYVTALQSFLTDGGTLEIKMDPSEKLTFGALEDLEALGPAALPGRLGLTVTHSE